MQTQANKAFPIATQESGLTMQPVLANRMFGRRWVMDFAGISFPSLTPLAVTLEGGWSPLPRRDWRGVAVASEPLVAVAFLDYGAVVEWCKSERGNAENLEVRLALLPYDFDGMDVQVNFSVGRGGCRWPSALASPDCVSVIPDRRELRTGVIERFAEVTGEPRVKLSILLMARRDVRSARNGLWRVRKELAALIPEPFRRTLTYGRTGRVERDIGGFQAEPGATAAGAP